MNASFTVKPIGFVHQEQGIFAIELKQQYTAALRNIKGFSHLQVISWGHLCDTPEMRESLTTDGLFKKGPKTIGVFGTRSPARPNPILVSTIVVKEINCHRGVIYTPYIDVEVNTPVLDIKPYYPMERVKNPKAPHWCSHWPQWNEEAASFNWADEIHLSK